jgi:uncharacterized membrane protein/uncharacterized RDD family membrane protein YckC
VVAPVGLVYDISSVAVSTAVPGIAWALWFGIAWRRPAFARSLGLGPKEFWLLLPGALLASFALLPLFPVLDDLLAVSFAGAVFPLAVGILALGRVAPPLRRATARLFVPLAVEVAALLGIVLLADAGGLDAFGRWLGVGVWPAELALVAAAAAVAVLGLALAPGTDRATLGSFGLVNVVLVLTFAGASAIPGVGIAESFPYYLVPPLLAGVFAAALAPWLFPGAEAFALPVGFLAAGWGVVCGADVLWQPPLYGHGPAGLYAIGGAGVLDLVYLSGFLGLLGAWGTHRLLGRPFAPVGAPVPDAPASPTRLVRRAYFEGVDGEPSASLASSAEAVRATAGQARRLLGTPHDAGPRPWDGLGVPGWVVSDTANLESAAAAGTADPREAVRGWMTARALVRLGEGLGRSRFASIRQRVVAFLIDVGVLGAAGAAVLAAIVALTPGNLVGVLSSLAVNAAVYGFVAVALLYFALAEIWTGATVGKRIVGIEVRDRALGRVGGVASFVRNTPLLPPLTLVSVGLALAVALAMRGIAWGASVGVGVFGGTLELLSIAVFVLAGVAITGGLGVITIRLTAEHQRIGDLWADTWVVRRPTPAARSSPAPGPVRYG